MIVELTPETFFENIHREGPLHVVLHYGANCGPCKTTLPHYENVASHFADFKVTNVKFYKFHQWEPSYKEFVQENNLSTKGVPTVRYFYMKNVINEETRSFNDPNEVKRHIMDTISGIEITTGMEFKLNED
jgi:thiol-disulfide isomerase/thioredoxin